jgi:hypothetical protein
VNAAEAAADGSTPPSAADPLAAATVGVAWLIVVDKPLYPLTVAWVAGDGWAAWPTLLALPAFLAIALLGRRRSFAARLALPLVGAADTLLATKLFGAASGTELFFVPCLLLAVLAFRAEEARWTKGLVALLFAVFALAHGRLGAPLGPWTADAAARLLELNALSVAMLCAFLGWRFAGRR